MPKKDKLTFSTKQEGIWSAYDEHIIPDTLKASKLHRGDIKIYSRKGGSDGELELARFWASMSSWTQDYFLKYVESNENRQAHIHVAYEVEGARAELK
jgi:hypothetical protein